MDKRWKIREFLSIYVIGIYLNYYNWNMDFYVHNATLYFKSEENRHIKFIYLSLV